jgi:hypothetical protein
VWCLSNLKAGGGGGSGSSGDDDTGDDTAAADTPTDDTATADTPTDDTPTDIDYDGSVNTTTSNDDSGMITQEGMLYGAVGLGGIAVLASLFYRSVSLPT